MKMPTRLPVYTGGSRMVCEHSSVWALSTENTKMCSGQQAPSPWQLYLLHPQILCARASLQGPLQSAFPCLCVKPHLPEFLITASIPCLQKAVPAAGRGQSLGGSPPPLPRTRACHLCNVFWEWKKIRAPDSFHFFSPAQKQWLHHQWILHKIKSISNSQPRNDGVQTQNIWVLKGKILDQKKKEKKPH